jgi:hypothetical protein
LQPHHFVLVINTKTNCSSHVDIGDGITAMKKAPSSTMEKEQIIANATSANFIVMNDGKDCFIVDGNDWPARISR